MKDKETEETFRNYITKCLEFCWMQILENKDVTLEDNLKNLSKIMPHKYKQIQASKVTVTWPALVDTGNTVEDAVLESKDNMHAARLSKKQKESKSNGKSKSEETEDITEQDNIDSQEISKPVGKGKNGQHSEADKTKGSHSKLTGEVKQEEPKNNDTGRGAHAEKPKIQQELNRSRRDGPTVMSDRQKVTPRAEIDEKNSNNTKIGNQTQKKETNEPSAGGREQISKAQQNTNF